MKGTRSAAVLPRPSAPPRHVAATPAAMPTATRGRTFGELTASRETMPDIWVMFPTPSAAAAPKTLKAAASGRNRSPRPFLIVNMGPPTYSPFCFSRKRTARAISQYLMPMPTAMDTHIHKSAPGPPMVRAMATPAMFPVPTVPASAVQTASKALVPVPFSFFRNIRAREERMAVRNFLICMKPVFQESQTPERIRAVTVGHAHRPAWIFCRTAITSPG